MIKNKLRSLFICFSMVVTQTETKASTSLFKGEVIVGSPKPRIYVDQLVASSIRNPRVLQEVASQLTHNDIGANTLLPQENPLVRHVSERMETEIGQKQNGKVGKSAKLNINILLP